MLTRTSDGLSKNIKKETGSQIRKHNIKGNVVAKRKVLITVCVFLISFGAFPVYAEGTAKKYILDTGMTVIAQEIPSSPTVALRALVKTGSTMEGKYLGSGISHFVEHMLFKGTEKRGIGQIAKEA